MTAARATDLWWQSASVRNRQAVLSTLVDAIRTDRSAPANRATLQWRRQWRHSSIVDKQESRTALDAEAVAGKLRDALPATENRSRPAPASPGPQATRSHRQDFAQSISPSR